MLYSKKQCILGVCLITILFVQCSSPKSEGKVFLDILEQSGNTSTEIERSYSIEFDPVYLNENYKILFYGVSIERTTDEENTLHSRVSELQLFNKEAMEKDCIPENNERQVEKCTILYEEEEENIRLRIGGRTYTFRNKPEAFNSTFSYNNSVYADLNKPIPLLSLREAKTYYPEEEQRTIEIGCVVYNCQYKFDWERFFASREFTQHTSFTFAIWNSPDAHRQEKFLSVMPFIKD